MEPVRHALHRIHSELAPASSSSQVRIVTEGNELRVTVRSTHLMTHLAAFFNYSIAQEETPNEARAHFGRFFGEKRVERLQKQYGFSLESSTTACPTRSDIEKLFIATATVSTVDLEEFLEEIQEEGTLRACSPEETRELRSRFKGKTLADCSKEDLDLLISYLAPFEGNDCFLNEAPQIESSLLPPFSIFEVRRQITCILKTLFQKNWSHIEWANYVGKRLSTRDPEKGLIVPHPQGYYEVFDRVQHNGACAFLLRPIGASSLAPLVLFRGTRGIFPADLQNPLATIESLKEDLLEELGKEGVMSSHSTLQQYFCKPELGFDQTPSKRYGESAIASAGHSSNALLYYSRRDLPSSSLLQAPESTKGAPSFMRTR